jgi:hypothetical protein
LLERFRERLVSDAQLFQQSLVCRWRCAALLASSLFLLVVFVRCLRTWDFLRRRRHRRLWRFRCDHRRNLDFGVAGTGSKKCRDLWLSALGDRSRKSEQAKARRTAGSVVASKSSAKKTATKKSAGKKKPTKKAAAKRLVKKSARKTAVKKKIAGKVRGRPANKMAQKKSSAKKTRAPRKTAAVRRSAKKAGNR